MFDETEISSEKCRVWSTKKEVWILAESSKRQSGAPALGKEQRALISPSADPSKTTSEHFCPGLKPSPSRSTTVSIRIKFPEINGRTD
mmetsp:Transcript_13146/g.25872  ORF Transcript_13146/g.25872 Transcript_13146/m.25872 type:complete len:88 (-) Transcript_13146:37-300(-)